MLRKTDIRLAKHYDCNGPNPHIIVMPTRSKIAFLGSSFALVVTTLLSLVLRQSFPTRNLLRDAARCSRQLPARTRLPCWQYAPNKLAVTVQLCTGVYRQAYRETSQQQGARP